MLFVIVMEAREFRVALPWELLYADDLAVIAETEEELIKRLKEWKDNVESKGMRVDMNKTKVMISGERQMVRQKDVRWPCGVCSKGVGSNSIQCSSCQKWVHKKCSGIKGSMSKVAKSFICRGCLNPVISAGHTSVDIGASAKLEFCLQCFDAVGWAAGRACGTTNVQAGRCNYCNDHCSPCSAESAPLPKVDFESILSADSTSALIDRLDRFQGLRHHLYCRPHMAILQPSASPSAVLHLS